jgi:HSP20 family molecular chaperone IbpA
MDTSLFAEKDYTVYPGEYVPMPETEMLFDALRHGAVPVISSLPLNMDEYEDCYKVEVSLPGVRRDEILIQLNEDRLTIAVMQKNEQVGDPRKIQMHEFMPGPVERKLVLPEIVDVEFVSASYREGILYIHLPKTSTPSGSSNHLVVVY